MSRAIGILYGMAGIEKNNRRPGDLILDRYMTYATPREREDAREMLREFVSFLYQEHNLSRRTIRKPDGEKIE